MQKIEIFYKKERAYSFLFVIYSVRDNKRGGILIKMKSSEKNFIRRLQRQKEDALEFVIDQYLPLVKGITYKILAPVQNEGLIEECINDIFLAVWENVGRFTGDATDFKKWICVIAKYKATDYYRKTTRIKEVEILADKVQGGENVSAEDMLVFTENKEEIITLLNELEFLDKNIFMMKYFLGYHNIEIASKLGLTKASVDNRIYRGKKKLYRKGKNLQLGGELT